MTLLFFLLMIGGLIFFHELGHYVFARIAGVQVVTFSVGIGPTIYKWVRKDTTYRIAAIPLGGYVRLLGDDPSEEVPEEVFEKSFGAKSLWKRFWIVFGGPLFNLILPFIIFFWLGFMTSDLDPSTVGTIVPGGPADQAQLESGDQITAIDGADVDYWWQMQKIVSAHPGDALEFEIIREGTPRTLSITPKEYRQVIARELGVYDTVGRIGIMLHYALPVIGVPSDSPLTELDLCTGDKVLTVNDVPVTRRNQMERLFRAQNGQPITLTVERSGQIDARLCAQNQAGRLTRTVPGDISLSATLVPAELIVMEVKDGSPAHEAGLRPADILRTLDGQGLTSWSVLVQKLSDAWEEPHKLGILRSGAEQVLTVKIREESRKTEINTDTKVLVFGAKNLQGIRNSIPLIGLPDRRGNDSRIAYGWHMMMTESIGAMRLTALSIVGLFRGRVAFKEMGGPIMVFNLAGASSKRGWEFFFKIMAVLSISLGLLNLLPIPVLDGGHILFIVIEAVQRKPISMRVRQTATYIGLAMVLLLMIMVFKNDIERNWESISGWFGS
jgi:regulator of sigma E protease